MIPVKIKTSAVILAVIIFLIFSLCSCAPAGQPLPEDTEPPVTEEEQPEVEEEIDEQPAEEVVELIDLDSASFGAVIDGYIPSYLCSDADNFVKVTLTNTSDFTWRAVGKQMVRIGYHFYGQDVEYVEYDKTTRTELPNNLEPGESAEVDVLINDVINPGNYVIHIDLVVEGYAWFSSKDVPMLEGEVFFNNCLAE